MASSTFTGFSTVDSAVSRDRVFYDLNLCITDLKNHFSTRPGERVMRPEWGCRVWDYIMEPLTEGIKEIIKNEVVNIVHSDNRCEIVSVDTDSSDHGVIVTITINYRPERVVSTFTVAFEDRNARFFQ